MSRFALNVSVWLAITAAYANYLMMLEAHGYVSPGMLELTGAAIMGAEGQLTFSEIVTAYPPFSLFVGIVVAMIMPVKTFSGVAATAAVAGLCVMMVGAVAKRQLGAYPSVVAMVLAGVNPFMLFVVAQGLSETMLLYGALLLAVSFFAVRRDENVVSLLKLAMSQIMIFFTHPIGMIVSFAALPFLILLLPSRFVARSPISSVLALCFPLLFAILSFSFVGDTFARDAWAFLRAGASSQAVLDASREPGLMAFVLGFGLCAPGVLLVIAFAPNRPFVQLPAVVLIATAVASVVLGLLFHRHVEPVTFVGILAAFGIVAAVFTPIQRWRPAVALAVLAVSGIGSALVLTQYYAPMSKDWQTALLRDPAMRYEPRDTRLLERLATDRDSEIMIDGNAHPELIALRGTSKGLMLPGNTDFELDVAANHPRAAAIVMRQRTDPQALDDRLSSRFQSQLEDGVFGEYALVFSEDGWLMFERKMTTRTEG